MKKILVITLAVALSFVGSFFMVKDAQAVPGFARQTGHACSTCHFQSFPSLNSFGRAFKASGYTQIGDQGKIEDEGLSIPNVLNMSLIVKARYSQTNGDSKAGRDRGQIEIPDEASLMAGGRGGEHVGFLLERGLKTSGGFDNFKIIFPFDMGGTTLAAGAFTTDALGAAYGFETLNTGALRLQKPFGEGVATSAQQYTGLNTAATGIVLYGASDMFFVNASLWGPSHSDAISSGLNLAQYIRAAVTPNLGGFDTAIGVQYWGGETKLGEATSATYVVQGTAIDAQAQGEIGGMPLGVYITYATVPKAGTDGKTYAIASAAGDKNATSIAANLGIIPNKASLGLSYLMGKNGAATKSAENAMNIAAIYKLAQNVKLQLDYATFSGDADVKTVAQSGGDMGNLYSNRTTLMIFAGF
ncbi:MAG: hypothetical protein HZA00_03795 [Nitrospinae bacterium]|nr:hypothetical protein [Nitrospinota bacterium]